MMFRPNIVTQASKALGIHYKEIKTTSSLILNLCCNPTVTLWRSEERWKWRIFTHPSIPGNKRGSQKSRNTKAHSPSLSLGSYQDPLAIGPPACNEERFQTTFLTPDGFVQTPWKPHTPQIHRRSASSSEEEQTLTATLSLLASDVFISPPPFVFNLTCNL